MCKLLVCISTAQPTPLLLVLSANEVTAGEQLIANCTASTPTAARTLYIDGVTVTMRISADRLSSAGANTTSTTWTIDPVLPGDEGEYLCFAGSQNAHSDSLPQSVTVYCELQACMH